MRKILFAAVALSFAGTGLAAADGAALFASKCVACHAKDGKGSAVGKKMGAKDLAEEMKEPEKEIVADITNGKNKMPAFKGKLTPEEIQAVAKYVKNGLK
jgi:mono/diheme cytochrome c family protein